MAGIETFVPEHFMEKGLTLMGEVRRYSRRKWKNLKDVYVGVNVSERKKVLHSGGLGTDSIGRFCMEFDPFEGREKLSLLVQREKLGDTDACILLHRHFSPLPRAYESLELDLLSVPVYIPQSDSFSFSKANILRDVTFIRLRRQMPIFTLLDIKVERERLRDEGIPERANFQ